MKRRTFNALSLAALVTPSLCVAQSFPTKPVKFIVPYAAGGLPDSVARIVANKLTEKLGQSVVIDNKPGGNGMVAYQALISGVNDNHSFIVSDGSMFSITPLINKSANYSIGRDLLPVSMIAKSPLFLVANPKTGIKTLKEFVEKVRANPGMYTYGSSGIGSSHHLTMESLKADLKLDIRHVPFRGSGQSVPALIGGQIDFLFSALPSMLGFLKAGQVTLLGSNDHKRSTQVPDVPSISEVVSGFDFAVTIGAIARAGTPTDVIKKLSDDIAWTVKQSDVVEKLNAASIDASGLGPDGYKKEIERENLAMAKAGKAADLKAE
ncbi:4,5-dihydroxyphthalate dehydrogenase [Limnohabitans sp. Rim8]|jgi:tripartite-type tricarboxylate transporter receptor subunit TctC|uniref:Bug family tripartite tricarboxylate transporter substrate binding protein n=1 Tax=Limnohabitans sp. Rim8 TaxID=1100718 RepID=UPI000D37AAEE|nr:tripartite tricarboxylate transporter substrate binding protein [Limnohabitans sp. Rim8]PUE62111.1 4,5-dihydroxyphthalate dehydrogenase [Limnohabitans sp. Rim8]